MLTRLLIRNFALVEELELEVGPGMTVITGETGAGKSILLDAVGLLLGDQAEAAHLRHPELRCVVEMEFRTQDTEVVSRMEEVTGEKLPVGSEGTYLCLRREISPQRRSRCLVNEAVVPLRDLKILAAMMLDLSGQEESVAVDRKQTQLLLLDQIAGTEAMRQDYGRSFRVWQDKNRALRDLLAAFEERQREESLNRFHWEELSQAGLEQWSSMEELEGRLSFQEHALEARTKLERAAETMLGNGMGPVTQRLGAGFPEGLGLTDSLREITQGLSSLAEKDPELQDWLNRLLTVQAELKELAREAGNLAEARIPDLEASTMLRDKVDGFQALLHKHRVRDLEDLRGVRARLGEALESTQGVDEAKAVLEKEEADALDICRQHALRLHLARTTALSDLGTRAEARLSNLAMEHARLVLRLHCAVPGLHAASQTTDLNQWRPTDPLQGLDDPELLFSANPGMEPRPLGQVASGGEKSRLLLALKSLVREEDRDHTRIFDEIDAGISGETALRMGTMLAAMGATQQILLITHLPPLAALGHAHWHVSKTVTSGQTHSSVRVLGPEDRLQTLASMIGGNRYGQAALDQAAELLRS
jgi:DNA repair protein RecN (Recombination protein N)